MPGAKVPIAAAAVVVYAWWATGLRPFTATSAIAVISAGIVAMAFGRFHCGSPETVRLCGTQVASWGALLGALAAWQFAAYLQHPRSEHPTLSSLANALLGTHSARTLAFLLWLAGAARLARR